MLSDSCEFRSRFAPKVKSGRRKIIQETVDTRRAPLLTAGGPGQRLGTVQRQELGPIGLCAPI
jgi:hypothetical protein